jgi:TPP-dependent pyruvate/acetoin dehydrogenase alpha subunit
MTTTKRLPRKRLVAFLGEMLLIRRFEEKVEERFRAGDLAGFCIPASAGRRLPLGSAVRSIEAT